MLLIKGVLNFTDALVEDIRNYLPDFQASRQVEVLIKTDAGATEQLPIPFSSLLFGVECALADKFMVDLSEQQHFELERVHTDTLCVLSFDTIVFNADSTHVSVLDNLHIIEQVEFDAIVDAASEDADWS